MARDTEIRRRRTSAVAVAFVIAVLVVPLVALAAGRDGAPQRTPSTSAATPSFARDVAPIIRETCAGCHRLDGIAPFAFRSEADVTKHAAAIVAAVGARRMPPWPPGPTSPRYVGQDERTLDAQERATLVRWAKAQLVRPGAPRGRTPVGKAPTTTVQPLPGERVLDLRMPRAYTPTAPAGGSDDYRCFLLDPGLREDAFVTSARIEPGNAELVHHVILYRVLPDSVAAAQRIDREAKGEGWTCFGGSGVPQGRAPGAGPTAFLDDAGWIAAWAPGWGGDRLPEGIGIELPQGSRVVMQVHYNLLNGKRPDRSRAVLTTAPGSKALTPVQTTLLPAPVELPCAAGERGPLCDRFASQLDQVRKFGSDAALFPTGLLLLCRKNPASPPAGQVSTCDRTIQAPTTIHAVAGHMHLLGRSIEVVLNPDTPRARVLLDIPRWDFHWQASYVLSEPVRASPGDVVRVTCRHDQALRSTITPRPKPRYVLWGEGTTDEMCLGVLQVTRG